MLDPAAIGFTRLPLRRLEPGQTIEGAACLRKATPGVTKNDAPYLNVELCNASGVVSGRIWSEQVDAWKTFPIGAPLQIRGAIKAGWQNRPPEIVIAEVDLLPQPHEIEQEVNATCPVPMAQLRERFACLIATMSPRAAELVHVVLESAGEEDWWDGPAAKMMHHAYIHGLAEHSIEVAELALAIARAAPCSDEIECDLLIVGALLHDVAKTREYRFRGVPIDLARTLTSRITLVRAPS